MILILLLLLAMFLIGAGLAWLSTTAYYETRIQQGEYWTPAEKEELAKLQKEIAKKQREDFGLNDWQKKAVKELGKRPLVCKAELARKGKGK